MVDRPYHDYSTSALRELSIDLASSQVLLEDQRADCVKGTCCVDDDLREFDVLINDLGDQLAAVSQELVTRHREREAAGVSAHRGVTTRSARVPRYGPQVMGRNPKPHCRAKRPPAALRRP